MTTDQITEFIEKRCKGIKLPFKKRLSKNDLLMIKIGYAKCLIDVNRVYSKAEDNNG